MANEITISVEEYKELVELKIRAEYVKEIENLKLELQAKDEEISHRQDSINYWFDEYQEEKKAKLALMEELDALKNEKGDDANECVA